MDYKSIIDNLSIESVKELMKKLGADRYIEKENRFNWRNCSSFYDYCVNNYNFKCTRFY